MYANVPIGSPFKQSIEKMNFKFGENMYIA